jgi:C1A family cysteine protease
VERARVDLLRSDLSDLLGKEASMPYRIDGLGWLPDPPDFRDYHLEDKEVSKSVDTNLRSMAQQSPVRAFESKVRRPPNSVDLRHLCSDVEDQQDIGSCTAQAVCALVEYLQRNLDGRHIDVSPLFLYKVTLSFLGWSGDTGAFVRSAIKALRLFGVPPEDYYPYHTELFDQEPAAFAYAFAGNYKAIQYHRLDRLEELKKSLAQGIPFAFGFTCYRSLYNPEVNKTGVIPLPTRNDEVIGGHAVMAVGYDNGKGHLYFKNSWGTEWGDDGYGALPFEYIEYGLAQDYWALTRMDIVQIDEFR